MWVGCRFECSEDTGRSFDEEDAILLTSIVSVEPHKSNLKDNHTKSSLDDDKDFEEQKGVASLLISPSAHGVMYF